jgi:hypothetical protein
VASRLTILYWQDIPSVVEARDASGAHKIELSTRFQELIDHVAMRKKLAGTDAYLEHWRKGRPARRDGDAQSVAQATADEIEARFEQIRGEELAKCRS